MNADSPPQCGECKFYLLLDAAEHKGVCRRFPAVPVSIGKDRVFSHFPTMREDGWCGEFARRETMQ